MLRLSGLFLTAGLYGCSQAPTASTAPPATPVTEHDDHSDHDHGGMESMEKGLASLSESDRASAMEQHVCPVTGEMLGTMGAPIKVNVKDHDVWVCCNGCTDKLKSDPDNYLAKLDHADEHGDHKHEE